MIFVMLFCLSVWLSDFVFLRLVLLCRTTARDRLCWGKVVTFAPPLAATALVVSLTVAAQADWRTWDKTVGTYGLASTIVPGEAKRLAFPSPGHHRRWAAWSSAPPLSASTSALGPRLGVRGGGSCLLVSLWQGQRLPWLSSASSFSSQEVQS